MNQTFQDFEVIFVDDCSTDNSAEIINSYVPKFNGRLQLVKLRKNSGGGGGGIPRNIGLGIARGKYILLIDSDDLITRDALEKLYKIAEDTNADVLHGSAFLVTKDGREEIDNTTEFIIKSYERGWGMFDSPIIETNDLSERIRLYRDRRFHWIVWNKLFRRDFLVVNNIKFPATASAEDMFFCFHCLCLAERYVRIPIVFNIYRTTRGSSTRKPLTAAKNLKKWLTILIHGSKLLEDFMDSIDYFEQNPKFKHQVIDFLILDFLHYTPGAYEQNTIDDVNEMLSKEMPDNSILFNHFFSIINVYRSNLIQSQQMIDQMQNQIQSLQTKIKSLESNTN